ncbi:ABC transporter permease [Planctomycetota bacterium]
MTVKLFINIFSMEARKLITYRVKFWLNNVIGIFAQFMLMYFLWEAMFNAADSDIIGGMDFGDMMLYYSLVIVFSRIVCSNHREGFVSREIYDGSMSRYLVYPTSYLHFKYAQYLAGMIPALVQMIIFMTLIPFFVGYSGTSGITVNTILMTIVSLLAANYLHFIIQICIEAIAFWAENIWSLLLMFRIINTFLGGFMIPLTLFPAWGQQMLAVLPFKYLFFIPVQTALGKVSFLDWLVSLVITLLWCYAILIISRVIWRRGDLKYTGVGI